MTFLRHLFKPSKSAHLTELLLTGKSAYFQIRHSQIKQSISEALNQITFFDTSEFALEVRGVVDVSGVTAKSHSLCLLDPTDVKDRRKSFEFRFIHALGNAPARKEFNKEIKFPRRDNELSHLYFFPCLQFLLARLQVSSPVHDCDRGVQPSMRTMLDNYTAGITKPALL